MRSIFETIKAAFTIREIVQRAKRYSHPRCSSTDSTSSARSTLARQEFAAVQAQSCHSQLSDDDREYVQHRVRCEESFRSSIQQAHGRYLLLAYCKQHE